MTSFKLIQKVNYATGSSKGNQTPIGIFFKETQSRFDCP